MAEKPRLMYSDNDINLIKATFAENEELLLSIRKLFFGAEISPEEKANIKNIFSKPQVKEVFRKKVYGLNNLDTPIGQLSDFWLGVETQVFGANRETIEQAITSKDLVLKMFQKAFDLLDNPDGEKVNLDFNATSLITDPLGIQIIARNLYMKAIETSLLAVQTIAGKKDETLEQTLQRLQKDSSR
jgi:hypothetical protein